MFVKTVERFVVEFQFTWDSNFLILLDIKGNLKIFCLMSLKIANEIFIKNEGLSSTEEMNTFLTIGRKIITTKTHNELILYNTCHMKNKYVEILHLKYKSYIKKNSLFACSGRTDSLQPVFEKVKNYGLSIGERIISVKLANDSNHMFVENCIGNLKVFCLKTKNLKNDMGIPFSDNKQVSKNINEFNGSLFKITISSNSNFF